MAKPCMFRVATILTFGLLGLARTPASAAQGPSDEVLKKHGLKIVGLLAVVKEEAEIKTKVAEARRLHKQLGYSLTQQNGTLSPAELQKVQKNVNNEISQLRAEMNAASQQMNAIPRYRGRFINNDASMLYSQLAAYRMQLQMELNQDSYFLNELKSQPADPKAREKIDSEVRDRRDAYHQAVLDLRELFDSATEKYHELKGNDEVKKALAVSGRKKGERVSLGPSHDFRNNLKLFEKMERADSNGETDLPEAKPARKNGRAAKTKQSAKPAGATDDAGKSP